MIVSGGCTWIRGGVDCFSSSMLHLPVIENSNIYYGVDSLQPHNILLSSKENSAPIKIADFGVATEIGEEGYVTSGKTKWTIIC